MPFSTESASAARAEADREKEACLAQIAADLPERAAEAAKRIATAQPEVTNALGKEGVAEMRADPSRLPEGTLLTNLLDALHLASASVQKRIVGASS